MYKLISHRGIHNKNIIENSYESIKKALESNDYLGVEFDVRVTKDHEFILFHDSIYNNKLIKNISYKDLPKYVPRLIDVLKINSNKIFLIEVKNINNLYKEFINILNRFKNKNIYVMSFSNNVINKLDVDNRKYKIGILNYVLNTNKNNNLNFVCILSSLLNDTILNTLSSKEIFSYGLNIKKEYKQVYYIVDK